MAKASGIGSSLFMAQYDLSGDIGAIRSIETGRATYDVTAINAAARERIMGLRSGSITYTAFWNIAAGAAHPALAALPRTDQMTTVALGQTVGSAGASMVGKQITYAPTRGADGSLIATITAQSNGATPGSGLDMSGGYGDGMLTTGKQTFASGTVSGTSIDIVTPTSTAFGGVGYLHVFSLGSGTPTVTIQDAATEPTYAALITFTPVTGVITERIALGATATVRRYVRVQVTGTYTNLVAAVNFVRYSESMA